MEVYRKVEHDLRLRPLEEEDLPFIHELVNDPIIMSYWFEEPYYSFARLKEMYEKHAQDEHLRRFIIESKGERIGLVDIAYIDYLVHRNAEFEIIISPKHQGNGYALPAAQLAMDYAFSTLNLHKLYLIVDKQNEKAIHIYKKLGFYVEADLKEEFFVNGRYHDVLRMCIFQRDYLNKL